MIKDASSSHAMPYSVSIQVVREGGGIIDTLTGHLFSQLLGQPAPVPAKDLGL
jgi:hypothetical protein